MERWSGKVAVVTGASSGIGYAISEELAKRDLIVVGLARRDDLIKKLAEKYKGKVHAVKCDMIKENQIIASFNWIEKTLGGVDLLINNAGVLSLGTLSEGKTEGWRQMLDVNVLGLSISTREALKTMRKRGDNGHIVNINSISGRKTPIFSDMCMYSASKFATRSLANVLRTELSTRESEIKVSTICPGMVHTNLCREAFKIKNVNIAPVTDPVPKGFLSPQDIADAVINVISMKPNVQIEELIIMPIGKMK